MPVPAPSAGLRDRALPVYLGADLDPASSEYLLRGDEARHAAGVRRVRVGERLVVTDGRGRWLCGPALEVLDRDSVRIAVTDSGFESCGEPTITVVQALPKSDRGELAVELMTEVGVDRIVPWQARRCVARWDSQRAVRGLRRWRRTAAEAAKQSRRTWVPEIVEPVDLAGVIALIEDVAGQGPCASLVCHEAAQGPLLEQDLPARGNVLIVVGPEGGVDDEELATLMAAGAAPVSLGPTVLRTSTAGAAAVLLVSADTGRLG